MIIDVRKAVDQCLTDDEDIFSRMNGRYHQMGMGQSNSDAEIDYNYRRVRSSKWA